MFKIYSQTDFKKVIFEIIQKWEKLSLPEVNKNELKITFLPFRRKGLHSFLSFMISLKDQPLLVVKMPRYENGKLAFAALKNEADMLSYLNQNGYKNEHIPQIYTFLDLEGIPVLFM
jgi:hypothetical protein